MTQFIDSLGRESNYKTAETTAPDIELWPSSKLSFDDELSDEQLQLRIEAALEAPSDNSHRSIHYGIKIGEYNLLVDRALHCEVINFINPAALPNTPDHFMGLCNVRGNLIPLYQLQMGKNAKKSEYRYIFIMDKKDKSAALALENLPVRKDLSGLNMKLSRNELETPKETKSQSLEFIRYVSDGYYEIDSQEWHLINSSRLFSELTKNKMSLQ